MFHDCYSCSMGSWEIWIENYPYDYGSLLTDGTSSGLPGRYTRKLLKEYLDAELERQIILESNQKKYTHNVVLLKKN